MLFNSLEFAIFLPVVFCIYWFITVKNLKIQNLFITIASYIFYGWWDWRFLSLIMLSTIQDYYCALKIYNSSNEKVRKSWLFLSITVNIGFLVFFKYYGFFIDNFVAVFSVFGHQPNIASLKIILPVGISFYTFQTLSYTIDVYRRKLEPTNDIVAFAGFVSFFPLLVAGPIERATNFLSQFFTQRKFEYAQAVDGLRQILWGLFKKIVVADSCAYYVNNVFANHTDHAGITLLIGAVFFAFQIYCDFSGYSDIAIGTARILGFKAMRNFNYPYFSRDIAEFWRRWHISLTTWFRDYVYIPLGGSRVSKAKVIRNTFVIFLVSGFWHGANWTFIIWGVIHAVLFMPLILHAKNRKHTDTVATGKILPSISEFYQMFSTFVFVVIGWVFFRAENMTQALKYLAGIFNVSVFSIYSVYDKKTAITILLFVIMMLTLEWIGRHDQYAIEKVAYLGKTYRWIVYIVCTMTILAFSGQQETFIYFQF